MKPIMCMLQGTLITLVDLFKITLASMLVVFVPQTCIDSRWCESLQAYCNDLHECTFEENFTNLTEYNKASLAWNFYYTKKQVNSMVG